MQVKIKKLHPKAFTPTYATDGSGCFDLYAIHDYISWVDPTAEFRTGLAFEIPEGHVMLIFSRSGHGRKYNTRLANCVGVIDSDYRGEVLVKLTNDNGAPLPVAFGDRIAQALVIPLPHVEFIEVDELTNTVRGAGGFGSSGA